MMDLGLTLEESLGHIQRCRDTACPNPAFLTQLRTLDSKLNCASDTKDTKTGKDTKKSTNDHQKDAKSKQSKIDERPSDAIISKISSTDATLKTNAKAGKEVMKNSKNRSKYTTIKRSKKKVRDIKNDTKKTKAKQKKRINSGRCHQKQSENLKKTAKSKHIERNEKQMRAKTDTIIFKDLGCVSENREETAQNADSNDINTLYRTFWSTIDKIMPSPGHLHNVTQLPVSTGVGGGSRRTRQASPLRNTDLLEIAQKVQENLSTAKKSAAARFFFKSSGKPVPPELEDSIFDLDDGNGPRVLDEGKTLLVVKRSLASETDADSINYVAPNWGSGVTFEQQKQRLRKRLLPLQKAGRCAGGNVGLKWLFVD